MVSAVLVGCGAMSKTWLEAAAETDGLTIAGLVDIDRQRAEARAGEFELDAAVIGSDLDAVLKRAGRHGVSTSSCRKPGATSRSPRSATAAICSPKSRSPTRASMPSRSSTPRSARIAFMPSCRTDAMSRTSGASAASSIPARSEQPTSVHCDFFVAPHFGGFREEMPHVLLLDMAIHTFDAARYMINGEPRAVYCREWEPKNSWYRQGSSAFAIFEMADGALFTYRGSWCAEGLRTSWESVWRIVGERGSLTWDGYDDVRAEITTGVREGILDKPQPVAVPPLDPRDRIGGHRGVIQDFVAAVLNGGQAGNGRHRQHQELRDGAFGDRKRRGRPPRRHHDLREPRDKPAPGYSHRHHGARQPRRSRGLCPQHPSARLRDRSSRSSGRRSAARTSKRLAGEIREAIGDRDVVVSSLAVFGNPLEDRGEGSRDAGRAGKRRSRTRTCSAPTSSPASPAACAASR